MGDSLDLGDTWSLPLLPLFVLLELFLLLVLLVPMLLLDFVLLVSRLDEEPLGTYLLGEVESVVAKSSFGIFFFSFAIIIICWNKLLDRWADLLFGCLSFSGFGSC